MPLSEKRKKGGSEIQNLKQKSVKKMNVAATTMKKKKITLMITGNGTCPQREKGKTRPNYNYQTPEGLDKVFGPTYICKQLRETGRYIELSVNIMIPPQAFDYPESPTGYQPNSLFLLHGAIMEVDNGRDVPNRSLTYAYYDAANEWLDKCLTSDDEEEEVEIVEIMVVGLRCKNGLNGKAMPALLERVGTQFPNVKITVVDITNQREGEQKAYLKGNTGIASWDNITHVTQDSRSFLQDRLEKELAGGDVPIKTIGTEESGITVDTVNKCFTYVDEDDKTVVKTCPRSDNWASTVWESIAKDNKYQVTTVRGGISTRRTEGRDRPLYVPKTKKQKKNNKAAKAKEEEPLELVSSAAAAVSDPSDVDVVVPSSGEEDLEEDDRKPAAVVSAQMSATL